ncbi:MAG: hypothetical protein PVG14_10480 [Anaerolineales bacterium]
MMSFQVILHIENTDPVLGEVEELPNPTDQLIKVDNPTLRDGNELPYVQNEVVTVYWPITKINFIEVLPSREEEEIIGFVRE